MTYFKSLLYLFVLLTTFSAQGKFFNNSYVSFEIPTNWSCKPYDVTWVCFNKLAQKQKEAVIIMVAKEAGVLDTLSQYQSFLKNKRDVLEKETKKIIKSKVLHVKQKLINSQPWVDSLHKESEVPHYFTRYLVTKCCNNSAMKLGMLVTLSAQENHYTKYANDFLKVINSLRVMDLNKTLKDMKSIGKGENMGNMSKYIEEIISGSEDEVNPEGKGVLFGLDGLSLSILGLLLLVALALIIRKRKKSKKQSKGKKSSRRDKKSGSSRSSSKSRR